MILHQRFLIVSQALPVAEIKNTMPREVVLTITTNGVLVSTLLHGVNTLKMISKRPCMVVHFQPLLKLLMRMIIVIAKDKIKIKMNH